MNELSLFSGAGGGLLGTMLLGFRPIGYVEWDDYCQRVIAARIRDGILPDAPIFGDIKTFIGEGFAASYQGLVDVVTGGFPCQPFSVAGKQKGAADERNMWPATAECIGIVRPRFVLLENVPGIRPYLPVVVRDLRRLGYEVSRPLILGADDVGAPHRRKRVWIVANGQRDDDRRTDRSLWRIGEQKEVQSNVGATPYSPSREAHAAEPSGLHAESCGTDSDAWNSNITRKESIAPASGSWGSVGESGWREPWPEAATCLCRVDDGVANRVDRLKALGNGQVSLCAAVAWKILSKMA